MKITTSIKLDKDVKTQAQKLAVDFGLSLSTLINAQLKQFIRDKQLVISTVPKMSSYLEKLLGPIEHDIRRGKNLSKPIKSKKDLNRYFSAL